MWPKPNTIRPGTDFCPLLQSLEHDHCQCLHWGHQIEGRIIVSHEDDSEETVDAGDFYDWPPGHSVRMEAASHQIVFSPAADMDALLDHVVSKMGWQTRR